jgi:hypothetical protein
VAPTVESPLERYCRLGGDLTALRERLPRRATERELVTNSNRIVITPYGEQDGNGVDLSLIRANMQRSVTERIRAVDTARRQFLGLRNHVRPTGR